MDGIYLLIFSILISLVVGIIGYVLKTAHEEFKGLIRHLMSYTTQLKEIIIGIQAQLEKGIEADIRELKSDVKSLNEKTASTENQISTLKEQIKRD